MNREYRSVTLEASREELLKLLDLGFHVIPRVDAEGKLVDLVTAEYDLASPEAPVVTRGCIPARSANIAPSIQNAPRYCNLPCRHCI
jgi:D-glycero-alpha-D-manno-heptose-7-phosphate kinase